MIKNQLLKEYKLLFYRLTFVFIFRLLDYWMVGLLDG